MQYVACLGCQKTRGDMLWQATASKLPSSPNTSKKCLGHLQGEHKDRVRTCRAFIHSCGCTAFCSITMFQQILYLLQKICKDPKLSHDLLLMDKILHQLIGSLSHYLQGFIHTRRCRISSINSITVESLTFVDSMQALSKQRFRHTYRSSSELICHSACLTWSKHSIYINWVVWLYDYIMHVSLDFSKNQVQPAKAVGPAETIGLDSDPYSTILTMIELWCEIWKPLLPSCPSKT